MKNESIYYKYYTRLYKYKFYLKIPRIFKTLYIDLLIMAAYDTWPFFRPLRYWSWKLKDYNQVTVAIQIMQP